MKTETYKLYSRVFWIFLPNVIEIDPYNLELHRFKFGEFFETKCILLSTEAAHVTCVTHSCLCSAAMQPVESAFR